MVCQNPNKVPPTALLRPTSLPIHSFQRETPTRFKKELLKSVIPTGASFIPIDGINKLLVNIGHKDDCLSRQEQDELLDEAVGHHDTRDVPVEKIMELV